MVTQKTSISKYISSLIFPFLLVIFSVTGIVLLQYPETKKKDGGLTLTEYQTQEKQEKQQLNVLKKTPTIGFNNLVADWLYLSFIQYFGDAEAREKTGYSLIPDYFTEVVDKDPHFINAIFQLEVATSLFAGLPQTSIQLLDKSLQSIAPKFITNIPPYYLWRSKGNNELLFIGDIEATKKSYGKSIEWAGAYDDDESKRIIGISRQSLQFLEKNPDSKFARIGAWVGVLANRPDEKTIKRVSREIEALGGKVTRSKEGMLTIKVSN